jgi:hypothetical protein
MGEFYHLIICEGKAERAIIDWLHEENKLVLELKDGLLSFQNKIAYQ